MLSSNAHKSARHSPYAKWKMEYRSLQHKSDCILNPRALGWMNPSHISLHFSPNLFKCMERHVTARCSEKGIITAWLFIYWLIYCYIPTFIWDFTQERTHTSQWATVNFWTSEHWCVKPTNAKLHIFLSKTHIWSYGIDFTWEMYKNQLHKQVFMVISDCPMSVVWLKMCWTISSRPSGA